MKERLLKYVNGNSHYWWTVSVLPGLYSLLYLYKKNYTLVNSGEQLLGLTIKFIVFPVIGFLVLDVLFKKFLPQHRVKLFYSFLIICSACFISLMVFMGWRWKALILLGVLVIISSFFVAKHYKKFVLLLLFMTVIAAVQLAYFYVTKIDPQQNWSESQNFEKLSFTKKPNIYLIQPDGYVGRKTLKNLPYSTSNDEFYKSLDEKGFSFNDDYRSNYNSTLTSNSALFNAQQHYFKFGILSNELLNARASIIGSNPVLRTFKNNGYTTSLITETTYFFTNRAEMMFDYSNIEESDLSYFPYFKQGIDIIAPLQKQLDKQSTESTFTFIQMLAPAHISVNKSQSLGVEEEGKAYLQRLETSNKEIIKMVELIAAKDANAIIMLVADHGGFVGLNYTGEAYQNPTDDVQIKHSIYSSLLATKTPTDFSDYLISIKSSVSVFPNLFAYLSDKKPVEIKDDGSYMHISEGAEQGIYRYFDNDGTPVTELIPEPNCN
jgi:hypothetical protein